jgi:hypothetical protein
MRILVCGGRDYGLTIEEKYKMHVILSEYKHIYGDNFVIIHGVARGADSLSGKWAKANGIDVIEFPANWNKHGKRAGPIRNQQMLDEGKPNVVIAFRGGQGTADMVKRSKSQQFEVREIL